MKAPTFEDIEVIKIIQKMTYHPDLYNMEHHHGLKNLTVNRLIMLGYDEVPSKKLVEYQLISRRTVNARLYLVVKNPGLDWKQKHKLLKKVERAPIRQVRRWAATYRKYRKHMDVEIERIRNQNDESD